MQGGKVAKLNIIELYAGTGRSIQPFLGWKRTGKTLLVDSNAYAKDVYIHNFPNANYANLDLETASARTLEGKLGAKVDILLGCPPCQGYSDCGTRTWNDARNRHMDRFLYYIHYLRPRAIAFENVPLAFRSIRFQRITRFLEQRGYQFSAAVLNAGLFGSCQTRQRLILIALHPDLRMSPTLPSPTHGGNGRYFSYRYLRMKRIDDDPRSMLGVTPASTRVIKSNSESEPMCLSELGKRAIPTVEDTLGDLPPITSVRARKLSHFAWSHKPQILNRMMKVGEGERWSGGADHFSQTYGRLHRKGLARTITNFFPNAGSGRFWHPTENRALSLREAARIQGFPDSFRFLDQHGKNCCLIGNALDSSFSKLTFSVLKKIFE